MRIALTIVAVALVAMLSTALIAPLLVDWSAHRSEIESRLAAMTGADIALSGPITLRLLPTPYLEVGAGSVSGKGEGRPALVRIGATGARAREACERRDPLLGN